MSEYCLTIAVPLTYSSFGVMIPFMEKEQGSLLYSLSTGLKGKSASVRGRQYVAHVKGMGTFDDDALQAAMAAELGKDVDYVRYVESVRRKVITAALRDGKRVYVGGMVLHPVVKGPFESIDGTFDPKGLTMRGQGCAIMKRLYDLPFSELIPPTISFIGYADVDKLQISRTAFHQNFIKSL